MTIFGGLLMAVGLILVAVGYFTDPQDGADAVRNAMRLQAGIGFFIAGSIFGAAGELAARLATSGRRTDAGQDAMDDHSGYIPPPKPRDTNSAT